MLVVDDAAVRVVFPPAEAIGLMRQALDDYSAGRVVQPLRSLVRAGDPQAGLLGLMPAWGHQGFSVKAIVIRPDNHARGLPSHQGAVLVFDPETGSLDALVDGSVITELRTAAASAVATDLLALPGAGDLAVLGAGAQARSHLAALPAVRPLRRARVWSRTPERARALAAWARADLGIELEPVPSVAEAVAGADLVCTTTGGAEPLLTAAMVAEGAHLNAVGSCVPAARELAADLVERSRVFVDSRESALAEAGDLLLAMAEGRFAAERIVAEVGEVLSGRAEGRASRTEVTLFESLGIGTEDLVAAAFVARAARERGLGAEVRLA